LPKTLPAAESASRSTDEVVPSLETATDKGLEAAEAKRRLEEVGPNVLDRASGEGAWGILWRQVNDPLIWVLLASAAVAFFLGEPVDALVVLAVVVLNTLIGFVQE
jgi:magnesium-transporting ATPase (P-type)